MKEENLYESYKCPNCNQTRKVDKLKHLFKWHRQYKFSYMISVMGSAKQGHLKWACDNCIINEKVLLAKPEEQIWPGINYPFFTYNDEIVRCESCECEFKFSKEEQKFWYEDLKFIVLSHPTNCPACRKRIRMGNAKSKRLTELINDIEQINANEIEEVIDIFLEYENIDKAKYYLSVLRKKNYVEDARINRIKEMIECLAQQKLAKKPSKTELDS